VELCRILADRTDLQVLLITGARHHDTVRGHLPASRGLHVRAVPFVERMDLVYAAADLAVARAGASTVAELTVCGVPAILVPYPYATGRHQEANARAVERAGGGVVLLDDAASGDAVADRMSPLLDDPARLESMARSSRRFGRPEAADAVAELAASVAGTGA
jgi:UDP-N-acetylglucosamine--N-acetylmuramyl-(pentapeptide) pyrophosphoryl-undecaprenol N-acetylglucosamine transferase